MNSSKKILGGVLLTTGSCIGAGMLALPIITGIAGFFPSLLVLFMAWGFMTFTALLLLEMNSSFSSDANIVSMAKKSLGRVGKWVSWVLYLFLFYSLLVAYVSGSGIVFSTMFPHFHSQRILSLIFTLFFGFFVYLGTRPTDLLNRLLMVGLIVSYFGMIFSGLSKVHGSYLLHAEPKYLLLSLPILVVSFGFHNMIPTLKTYLDHNIKDMKKVILWGSLLVLLVYLAWMFLVMGVIPFSGKEGIWKIYEQKKEASTAISFALGGSFVAKFAKAFAFFAIVTSFLAQSLSLLHFLADGLQKKIDARNGKYLVVLTLAPPLFFAFYNPSVFTEALSFAGGFCAVILFGILPILMTVKARYQKKIATSYTTWGGKPLLLIAFGFALFIFLQELIKLFR